jgi:hypothetical protein
MVVRCFAERSNFFTAFPAALFISLNYFKAYKKRRRKGVVRERKEACPVFWRHLGDVLGNIKIKGGVVYVS